MNGLAVGINVLFIIGEHFFLGKKKIEENLLTCSAFQGKFFGFLW